MDRLRDKGRSLSTQVPQEVHKRCSDTVLDPDTPEKATKAYTRAHTSKINSKRQLRGERDNHKRMERRTGRTHTDHDREPQLPPPPTAHTQLLASVLRQALRTPEISLIDTHYLTDNTHIRPSDRLGI